MKFGRAGVIAVATRKKNNLYGDQENSVARNTILCIITSKNNKFFGLNIINSRISKTMLVR